tara:strand:- start:859 stop:1023 length:165 start_codon:yes stop_codon:yes gene_type:complete
LRGSAGATLRTAASVAAAGSTLAIIATVGATLSAAATALTIVVLLAGRSVSRHQ